MHKRIEKRINGVRARLRAMKLDGMLVTDETNVRYLSGFTGDSSAVLITGTEAVFVTDFRYTEQAEAECSGYRIIRRTDGMAEEIARQARSLGVARLGIEASTLSVRSADHLREAAGKIEVVNTTGVVESLREVKDGDEVAAIESTIRMAEACFERVRRFIVPGIRERDIAAELEYFVRGQGFDGMAFQSIVAFGPRGSLPHARAGAKRMKPGDAVLLDIGVAAAGYVSDLTRVFFHNKIPRRFERIYRVVLEAQRRAIRKIRPGVKASVVDAAARKHIKQAGFGRRFGHGLGHGIGMQVHEGPTLGPTSSALLRKGMVFTVEPGIYIPGVGGVRIEDDVLVTARGARVLSNTPKRLEDMVV